MAPGKEQRPVHNSEQFQYIADDSVPIDGETLLAISNFAGGNPLLIQTFMGIVPYFTLFHSMYLRAISRTNGYTMEEDKGGLSIGTHGEKWKISRESYDAEYGTFLSDYQSLLGGQAEISIPQVLEKLDTLFLGKAQRDRFFKYFTGGESPSTGTAGSCAWPLGCVQNLPAEDFKFSYILGNEQEHSRPESLWFGAPTQEMCTLHNSWKTDNLLFDLTGILYCIFGPAEE